MNAEILAVGSELLTPQRVDTNSLYLTQKLNEIGIEVTGKSVIGDDRARLTAAIVEARARAALVILTGGLGPTEDDVTRDAVAAACGRELVFHQQILDGIEERFRSARRQMAAINRRQAYLVAGAEMLPNARGTAPGQWLADPAGILILLPGPPNELQHVFALQCLPRLRKAAPPAHIATRVLRVTGLPESDLDQRIAPIYQKFTNPVTTILAAPGDIQVHLRGRGASESEARVVVEELARQIEAELGDRVYSRDGESLEETVARALQANNATLAVAESCTGGMLAERLTSVPGSSKHFRGAWVTYTNAIKTEWVGVRPETLQSSGAVSAEAAREMAEGVRRLASSTLGVAVTGVAGPTPDDRGRPIGLVFLALADGQQCTVKERQFLGERDRVRLQATQAALDLIRRRFLT